MHCWLVLAPIRLTGSRHLMGFSISRASFRLPQAARSLGVASRRRAHQVRPFQEQLMAFSFLFPPGRSSAASAAVGRLISRDFRPALGAIRQLAGGKQRQLGGRAGRAPEATTPTRRRRRTPIELYKLAPVRAEAKMNGAPGGTKPAPADAACWARNLRHISRASQLVALASSDRSSGRALDSGAPEFEWPAALGVGEQATANNWPAPARPVQVGGSGSGAADWPSGQRWTSAIELRIGEEETICVR